MGFRSDLCRTVGSIVRLKSNRVVLRNYGGSSPAPKPLMWILVQIPNSRSPSTKLHSLRFIGSRSLKQRKFLRQKREKCLPCPDDINLILCFSLSLLFSHHLSFIHLFLNIIHLLFASFPLKNLFFEFPLSKRSDRGERAKNFAKKKKNFFLRKFEGFFFFFFIEKGRAYIYSPHKRFILNI